MIYIGIQVMGKTGSHIFITVMPINVMFIYWIFYHRLLIMRLLLDTMNDSKCILMMIFGGSQI